MGEGSSDAKMVLVPKAFITTSVQKKRAGIIYPGAWFHLLCQVFVSFHHSVFAL